MRKVLKDATKIIRHPSHSETIITTLTKYKTKYDRIPLSFSSELFYVRQHMPVPDLEASNHKLRITIVDNGVHTTNFTLDELTHFRRGAIRAALMCAGNRRSEMDKVVTCSIAWG